MQETYSGKRSEGKFTSGRPKAVIATKVA